MTLLSKNNCFVKTGGRFFQILWLSHNVWTLTCIFYQKLEQLFFQGRTLDPIKLQHFMGHSTTTMTNFDPTLTPTPLEWTSVDIPPSLSSYRKKPPPKISHVPHFNYKLIKIISIYLGIYSFSDFGHSSVHWPGLIIEKLLAVLMDLGVKIEQNYPSSMWIPLHLNHEASVENLTILKF